MDFPAGILIDADQGYYPFLKCAVSGRAMASAMHDAVPVEMDLLILSFLGHFAWELLQAPFFSSLQGTGHFEGVLICLRATLGDLGIALAAFWCAAWFGGGRGWVARPSFGAVILFLGLGLVATIGFEFVSTEVLNRWSYGAGMPRLPIVGIGIAPLLQWLIVPTLVLWYLKRLGKEQQRP